MLTETERPQIVYRISVKGFVRNASVLTSASIDPNLLLRLRDLISPLQRRRCIPRSRRVGLTFKRHGSGDVSELRPRCNLGPKTP